MMGSNLASMRAWRWSSANQFKASLLSLLFLMFALLLLWMGHWMQNYVPEEVSVREVSLTAPPPPPPPPPPQVVQTPRPVNSVQLQVEGVGPQLPMFKIETPDIKVAQPEVMDMPTRQTQWQSLEVNWEAFSLDDLDALPALLTPVRAVIPKSLERRGINHILIKLDVVIDESGQVNLVKVVENPYPELASEIRKIVKSSRFSPPKKGDDVVRARFIWPIEIAL